MPPHPPGAEAAIHPAHPPDRHLKLLKPSTVINPSEVSSSERLLALVAIHSAAIGSTVTVGRSLISDIFRLLHESRLKSGISRDEFFVLLRSAADLEQTTAPSKTVSCCDEPAVSSAEPLHIIGRMQFLCESRGLSFDHGMTVFAGFVKGMQNEIPNPETDKGDLVRLVYSTIGPEAAFHTTGLYDGEDRREANAVLLAIDQRTSRFHKIEAMWQSEIEWERADRQNTYRARTESEQQNDPIFGATKDSVSPSDWLIFLGETAKKRVAATVITELENMTESLSLGDDDCPLTSVWEEYCAQVQGVESPWFSVYEDIVRDCIEPHLNSLSRDELAAVWAESDSGIDWFYDDHARFGDNELGRSLRIEAPIANHEVVQILFSAVWSEASNYESPTLYAYRYDLPFDEFDNEDNEDDENNEESEDIEEYKNCDLSVPLVDNEQNEPVHSSGDVAFFAALAKDLRQRRGTLPLSLADQLPLNLPEPPKP